MSVTWRSEDLPARRPIGPAGWTRVALKGGAAGLVTFGGLGLLLLARLAERPLFGLDRPWTPRITQVVCRTVLAIIGIGYRIRGTPMRANGAAVTNHSSWLDIFALNAAQRVYFVAKSEVAGWPIIGWLPRATGTVFIDRDRRHAKAQERVFAERLKAGHHLVFFPEGTSTDGRRVLSFKSTLFAAFYGPDAPKGLAIQPVTALWRAPAGEDPRFYGWWGDMDFGPHLARVLAAPRHGSVELVYHVPIPVVATPDRKTMAEAAEAAVRSGLPPGWAEPK